MKKVLRLQLTLAIAWLVCGNSHACTIFSLSRNNISVYGQNLDWRNPVSGYVIVNKRGISKSILHWKGRWPAAKSDIRTPLMWESKYGSVTFTYLGRDFIEGGMNEAGLMVDEATLMAVYPPDDGRPGISCGQWMQYQLDNYETVDEVLMHLDELRPDGEEWHYLISDRFGNVCAIEYLNGTPTVYRKEDLKYPVLTNTSYVQAMSHIPMDKAFGGEIDIAAGTDSYGRFVKTARLMDDLTDPQSDLVEYAFRILFEVSNETTRRSVVYDSYNNLVLWRSEKNAKIRWIDLNETDFSPGSKTLMINADTGDEGNLTMKLEEYDEDVLRDLLFKEYETPSQETLDLIGERGYTLKEVLLLIIKHPGIHAREKAPENLLSQSTASMPGMLVSTEWLENKLADPDLVILHLGKQADFEKEHIPGARLISVREILTDSQEGIRHELPDNPTIEQTLRSWGINNDSKIIIDYADANTIPMAARLFFTLDYAGMGDQTAILNGGFPSWKTDDRPRTNNTSAYAEGNFSMSAENGVLIRTDELLENLHNPRFVIVDARPEGQYSGTVNDHNSPRQGHIEGAVNLPFTLLTLEDAPHVFKPREAMEKLFEDKNIPAGSTLVTYCGSGIWASPVYFAARYLGYKIRFYDASFQEWGSNPDLPVIPAKTKP